MYRLWRVLQRIGQTKSKGEFVVDICWRVMYVCACTCGNARLNNVCMYIYIISYSLFWMSLYRKTYVHIHTSHQFGQIITTSAEVTLNAGLLRESLQNPINLRLGLLIFPDKTCFCVHHPMPVPTVTSHEEADRVRLDAWVGGMIMYKICWMFLNVWFAFLH